MYCHPGGDCHSGEVNPSYISIWVKSKTGLCSALLFQTSCGGWDQRDPTRQLESVWLALAFIILHFVAAWEDFKEWIHLVSTEMTSTKPDIYRNPRNEKAHWHHLEHAACLHNKDTEGFQITVNSPFFWDDILLGQPLLVAKKKAQFLSTKRRDFIPPKKTTTAFWMVEKFYPEKLPPSPAVENPFTKVDRSCPFFWTQTLSVFSFLENDRSCPQFRERAEILVKSQNQFGKKQNRTFSLFKTNVEENTSV